ncbi:tRNA pseudouridine(38-40) synthase TruA [Amphibacillus cookii]|uniref:tRNA pseudouridine(38-40) synthase TruA n=1 Tax=Amphibacillus cookii TaxID=767787 RepID=UPI0019560E33|nr:tRNA pseudouridine(38-40) synthase TruA [Amphibacillus cookii]MBM7542811.1 tRNA pseudouridine38-40 synthase [Amphibacillus cookii]
MRMLATVSYDGTAYAGYQVQPNQTTIQSTIEAALRQIHKGKSVKIVASGRTDAGVHAIGQTFHFDSHLAIPPANWKKALNAVLPNDIVIKNVMTVTDDFHARYDVCQKTYRYVVLNAEDLDPFTRNYSYHIKRHLDIEAINKACSYLLGEHDFTAFCAANHNVKGSMVREIYQACCVKEANLVTFTFSGNGFLYNMVRIIVGTLIEVGLGERTIDAFRNVIESLDRSYAGKTAPAQGLYLQEVQYKEKN